MVKILTGYVNFSSNLARGGGLEEQRNLATSFAIIVALSNKEGRVPVNIVLLKWFFFYKTVLRKCSRSQMTFL